MGSEYDLVMTHHLKKLLGYTSNGVHAINTVIKSENKTNINLGLKYIKVHCNIVDGNNNINEKGERDNTIVSLPITTTQPLFGTVQEFFDIESRVRVDNGKYHKLHFAVTDQDNDPINVGSILIEMYITN